MPDEAQPGADPQGQGPQAGDASALYADVLDGVPEQFHAPLTERIKARESEQQKAYDSKIAGWKPYEELGINDVDPEALSGLLTLGQALEAAGQGDQQALADIQEWMQGIQQSLGFQNGEAGEEQGQASDLLDLSPDQLQEMIGEQMAQYVNPLLERMDQQEQQQLLAEAEQEVQDSISTIRKENPDLSDDDENRILAFAYMFGQDAEDPVSAGFEEFKKVAARGESNLFGQKLNQPSPAEGAGTPNTTPPEVTLDNVKELARERFRQAQTT